MMVILHGLGRHAAEWSGWDGFVPDLPELRTNDRPNHTAIIARLIAELDARGIRRATWLGHSYGAHLAVELALRHRERVDRLILLAAAPSLRALDHTGCPALVVLGALDGIQVAGCGFIQVEVLDGVGHDPHLEAPERVRSLIAAWPG